MGGVADGEQKLRPLWVPWYRDWLLAFIGAMVLGLDQLTKLLVRANLEFRESFPSDGHFRIVHTYNTGSAFGLFRDQTLPLVLASVVGIAILIMVYRSSSGPSLLLRLSLGLQLGGAFGNLLDRVRMGHVTDFISIGSWPVFNLADASIVVGIGLLAWLLLQPNKGTAEISALLPPAAGAGPPSSAAAPTPTCPLCDGDMLEVPGGSRCGGCGARERIESDYRLPRDHHCDYP